MSDFLIPSLLLSLFMNLLVVPCPCGGSDYYIKPSVESECPSTDKPCKTLDEYANNSQELKGDVAMLFLTGVHNLTTNLSLSHLITVQMKPAPVNVASFETQLVLIQLLCCNITFDSISNVGLENLTITGSAMYSLVIRDSPAAYPQELLIDGTNLLGSSLIYTYYVNITNDFQISLTIRNSNFKQSSVTGLQITDMRRQGTLKVEIINSNISYHQQGGISIKSFGLTYSRSYIIITDSIIEENSITNDVVGYSAGLGVYSTQSDVMVTVSNTHFVHNQDLRGQPIESVFYVSRANIVSVIDCEFRDNRGNAIRVVNVKYHLRLYGNVTFVNNTAQQGGALALVSTQVHFMPESHILFKDNHADDVGGAIHIESTSTVYETNDPNTCVECFYMLPFWDPPYNYSIVFTNNSAKNGGHHIYGASLMSYCVVYTLYGTNDLIQVRSNDVQVRSVFHIEGAEDSPISSRPSRVCVLESSSRSFSDNCADVSHIFMILLVFPGEEFNLEAILTGVEFGTGTGEVYAQFLPINGVKPSLQSPYQYSQRVNHLSFSQTLNYSVFSKNSCEVLVLAATTTMVVAYGNEDQIKDSILTYSSTGIIPASLLTTPVYIKIMLSPCPLGFYLDPKSMGCKCNPKLCNGNTIRSFLNGRGFFYLQGSVWVNASTDDFTPVIILHLNCPFDYCNVNTNGLDLNDAEAQCAM